MGEQHISTYKPYVMRTKDLLKLSVLGEEVLYCSPSNNITSTSATSGVQKRGVRLVMSASYGEFIEQTVTETFQHAQKFWDNALYLPTSFSENMAQTQSLFGACCLRMLLHLRHYLYRVHSDLNNMLFTQYVELCHSQLPTNHRTSLFPQFVVQLPEHRTLSDRVMKHTQHFTKRPEQAPAFLFTAFVGRRLPFIVQHHPQVSADLNTSDAMGGNAPIKTNSWCQHIICIRTTYFNTTNILT